MQSRVATSQKILFISDVHFGAFSEQKNNRLEEELINLINFAQKNDFEIALLGDLFDYWIEYPNFVPSLGSNLLQRFKEFNKKGNSTLYITGNHDNWTVGHFSSLGFDVEPNYRILSIDNSNVLVLHGDATGKDLNSLKRPLFHQLLRNTIFLKIYRTLLPPKTGIWLMSVVSKLSNLLEMGRSDIKKLDEWSAFTLKNNDIDYVICGHDHTPRCLTFSFGSYLNLGTFHHHKSLVMYNNGTFKLVNWNNDNQELTPYNSGN